jgi:hypothetical protein
VSAVTDVLVDKVGWTVADCNALFSLGRFVPTALFVTRSVAAGECVFSELTAKGRNG